MEKISNTVLDVTGRHRTSKGQSYSISASDLAGANSGQRPDLLLHRYKYWLLEGTDTLYTSNGITLEPANDAAAEALNSGIDSPVFVTPGGALVNAVGTPIVVSGGGTATPQYSTYADLPALADVGQLAIVVTATGIPFINRKVAGVYRYSGSTWLYLGEVPDGYFVDNVTVFFDDADPTKKLKFQISALSTNTERTFTFPDKSGVVATIDDTTYITVASTPPPSPTLHQLWLQI